MSDTTIGGGVIPTTATLTWRSGRTVPSVRLSFDGLNSPAELLSDLAALGWDVPPVPPRPSSAIEWVPDPIAGTTYTVHPWTVEDFALGRTDWAPSDGDQVTAWTIETLRRHGVEPESPTASPDDEHDPGDAPVPARAQTVAAPQVILLGYEGAPHPDFWSTPAETGGRARVGAVWTECAAPPATACPSPEARSALAADSSHAWEVVYARQPAIPADDGQASICAAIPGASSDDKKLTKLVSMLGGDVQLAVLRPLDPTVGEAGALVFGVVPANAAELAVSTLRLKCSGSIVRLASSGEA